MFVLDTTSDQANCYFAVSVLDTIPERARCNLTMSDKITEGARCNLTMSVSDTIPRRARCNLTMSVSDTIPERARCNFENGYCDCQNLTWTPNWIRHSGQTPTKDGPSIDHTLGTASGKLITLSHKVFIMLRG